jgi:hypothetical protein
MAVCRDKPSPTVPLHGLQPEEPYPLAPLLCRNSPVTAQSLPWPSCPPPHGGRTACARLHSEPCVGVDSLPAWPCPPPLPTTPCYSPHGHRWVTLKYPCATPARSSVRGVVSPGSLQCSTAPLLLEAYRGPAVLHSRGGRTACAHPFRNVSWGGVDSLLGPVHRPCRLPRATPHTVTDG